MTHSTYYPDNYTIKPYNKKGLTQQQINFCEAFIAEGLSGVAAKIAGYKSPNRAASYLLNTKRIRDYLAKRQPRYVNCPVTFESKLILLDKLMTEAIDKISYEKPNVALIDRGLKAIEIANQMQGHNAPTQTQAVTVNVKATQDKMLEARKQYDEY